MWNWRRITSRPWPRADGWFATGKILSARDAGAASTAPSTPSAAAARAWRVGSGRLDGPCFPHAAPIWSPPWTAALFRAELFQRVGLLDESFESYLEDVDFGLRCARGMGSRDSTSPRPWPGIGAAPRSADGIPKRCAASPATRFCCWPAIIRGVCCCAGGGRSWWRNACGARWRCGTARAWPGCAGSCRASEASAPRAKRASLSIQDYWNILRVNERHDPRHAGMPPDSTLYWKLYFLLTGGGAK